MTISPDIGLHTLQSRVESWECDFNSHWNARYQGRVFQHAAEVAATRSSGVNLGGRVIQTRTIRFHNEAVSGDPVQIRSAAVSSGAHAGAVAHFLFSSGRLASTALDLPGTGSDKLPQADTDAVQLALPRTLTGEMPDHPWSAETAGATLIETGPVQPAHLDHAGYPLFEDIVGRSATAVHDQMDRLGFTSEFMKRERITRMAVETRIIDIGDWPLGAPLQVRSQITGVSNKTYRTAHDIVTLDGSLAARIEYNFLAVDTVARRATALPNFLTTLSSEISADSVEK